ncbi:hypothetical protein C8R44DRAFT_732005 [Mycena epipterygia]|nr:hypothetical protein C8R44DRAFT_732005 [Mycena epipterygia]
MKLAAGPPEQTLMIDLPPESLNSLYTAENFGWDIRLAATRPESRFGIQPPKAAIGPIFPFGLGIILATAAGLERPGCTSVRIRFIRLRSASIRALGFTRGCGLDLEPKNINGVGFEVLTGSATSISIQTFAATILTFVLLTPLTQFDPDSFSSSSCPSASTSFTSTPSQFIQGRASEFPQISVPSSEFLQAVACIRFCSD